MSNRFFFLGANTAEGFRSVSDELQSDPRIRQLTILKGGPGCGKSTLMRRLCEAAEKRGCVPEIFLCSSDPDSLDALIVPEVGFAVVDGTAPHVVEPKLCGLGACYLDLGSCLDSTVLEQSRAELEQAQQQNAVCYPLCYAALKAAGAVSEASRRIAAAALPPNAVSKLLPALPILSPCAERGRVCRRFLSGFTPKGALLLDPSCKTLHLLKDSYGLGAQFLADASLAFRRAGLDCIEAPDPLAPSSLQALLIPALSLGYVRTSSVFGSAFPALSVSDLDAALLRMLDEGDRKQLEAFSMLLGQSVSTALSQLKRAKQAHDRLEAGCRPSVDFAAVDRLTDRLLQRLAQAIPA